MTNQIFSKRNLTNSSVYLIKSFVKNVRVETVSKPKLTIPSVCIKDWVRKISLKTIQNFILTCGREILCCLTNDTLLFTHLILWTLHHVDLRQVLLRRYTREVEHSNRRWDFVRGPMIPTNMWIQGTSILFLRHLTFNRYIAQNYLSCTLSRTYTILIYLLNI